MIKKHQFYLFMLHVYVTYIKEDFELYTNIGKKFIRPAYIVRGMIVFLFSFMILPEYLIKRMIISLKLKNTLEYLNQIK